MFLYDIVTPCSDVVRFPFFFFISILLVLNLSLNYLSICLSLVPLSCPPLALFGAKIETSKYICLNYAYNFSFLFFL